MTNLIETASYFCITLYNLFILLIKTLLNFNSTKAIENKTITSNGRFKGDFIANIGAMSPLGWGTFGNVVKVTKKSDNNVYALKIVKYETVESCQLTRTIKEVRRLASLDPHLNIIRYFDCWIEDYEEDPPEENEPLEIDEDDSDNESKSNVDTTTASLSTSLGSNDDGIVFDTNYQAPTPNPASSINENLNMKAGKPGDQYLYILTALYDQSLFNWYKTQPMIEEEEQRKCLEINCLKQLSSAMNHCHRRHIIHGDLKPENIFIVSSKVSGTLHLVIGDFGISDGTEEFMSPEQKEVHQCLQQQKQCRREDLNELKEKEKCLREAITNSTDVFSMGLLFVEFILKIELTGTELWLLGALQNDNSIMDSDLYPHTAPQELRGIIKQMTEQCPPNRETFEHILNKLNCIQYNNIKVSM